MNARRTFIHRALAAAVTAVAALYVPGRPWALGVQEIDPTQQTLWYEARISKDTGEVVITQSSDNYSRNVQLTRREYAL